VYAEFKQRKLRVDEAVEKDKESKLSDQENRRVMRNANASKEEAK
jgi:hypothetical protein